MRAGTASPARRKLLAGGAALLFLLSVVSIWLATSRGPDLPPAPPVTQNGPVTPAATSPAANDGAVEGSTPSAQPGRGTSVKNGSAVTPGPTARPAPAALPASPPTRLRVPALGLDTSLVRLGLAADRTMEVPQGARPVGWFTKSPTPGQIGPSVFAGHVSWNGERGVFFKLGQMRTGDRIEVTRADGRRVAFSVTAVRTYSKDAFPSGFVYGNTTGPEIRLITCGGDYDPDAPSKYADNVVVYATMIA